LALTSLTSGGISVGIVRSETQATEFSLVERKAEKEKNAEDIEDNIKMNIKDTAYGLDSPG
jgi:hypothetical protein